MRKSSGGISIWWESHKSCKLVTSPPSTADPFDGSFGAGFGDLVTDMDTAPPGSISLNPSQENVVNFLKRPMRGKCEFGTPQVIFDPLNREFGFTLDPRATAKNAKCEKYFTVEENRLLQPWDGAVFMNPPFRDCDVWIEKAYRESLRGATVVCLMPARVDTAWWHEYAIRGEIRWIRGRIHFDGAEHNAPFSCVLIIFRPPKEVWDALDEILTKLGIRP